MSTAFLTSYLQHPLTRRRPLGPLGRYLKWQLTSRISGKQRVFPFVADTRLIARRSWDAINACLYFGLPEFESMAFMLHVLRQGDVAIDAGAHAGAYAIAMASRHARVIAIEPDPDAADFLREHVALNGMHDDVSLVEAALGATPQILFMSKGLGQQNAIVNEREGARRVSAQTLDEIVGERQPVCMKLDVEGYELNALKGAQHTLDQLKVISVETMNLGSRYGYSDQLVLHYLLEQGFVAVDYDPWNRSLTGSERIKGMRLMVRDIKWAETRVRDAEPIRFFNWEI